ncbi:putative Mg2+ transporter-C (MgtC) family protein [Silvibacterium bohemicum]|uniref:Putative Mg2+ transporter-C (MgtC) family protein n=1 Tax=Silvibacterium bohemicum TaxID=1577686 RepID=A0A841JRI9_9BACT|nr:MgtC/SapB family protein [Silvibacterium bohemicum]MBB6143936.1 putative Mg2+ transporter-C (MgtC) family protein [Silvibacterium bohemicum]
MPVTLSWQQIALRMACAFFAGGLIGVNRDGKGRPAGMRTTVLVCLAACVAMLQANLLMNSTGKTPNSFVVLDLMRLPLGILTGIGFIGAGAILRRGDTVLGVTTAATLWMATVMGLCFGGGQLLLGGAAAALTLVTLSGLKWLEHRMDQQHRGKLTVTFNGYIFSEDRLRHQLRAGALHIHSWSVLAAPEAQETTVECELRWQHPSRDPFPPDIVPELQRSSGVTQVNWQG